MDAAPRPMKPWQYLAIQAEMRQIRSELSEIAQAYNTAGRVLLSRLYPESHTSHGMMPGTLRSLEHTRSLLERLEVLHRRAEG